MRYGLPPERPAHRVQGLGFSLLSDLVSTQSDGSVAIAPHLARFYGTGDLSARFGVADFEDDNDAKERIAGRAMCDMGGAASSLVHHRPDQIQMVVSQALRILVRRWARGGWPIGNIKAREKHSLRSICNILGVDPGQMSRTIAGRGMFSLPVFTAILKSGGYRLAVVPSDSLKTLAAAILDPDLHWKPELLACWTLRHKRTLALRYEMDHLPLMWPGSRDDPKFYGRQERLYVDELVDGLQQELGERRLRPRAISQSHWSRVRRGRRRLSIDSVALAARDANLEFVIIPIVFPCVSTMVSAQEFATDSDARMKG